MIETEELINKYIFHAKEHGASSKKGDYKKTNYHHDELLKVLDSLLALGEIGEKAILTLIDHDDESVSLWAATHALKINEQIAKKKLKEVSKSGGFYSFDAEMVLSEWEKGNL